MKVAEALIARANAQKRIEELKVRLTRNVKVQEGDVPSERPEVLMEEFERTAAGLLILIQKINRTNATTAFDETMSIADAIAVRDVIRIRHKIYADLASAASVLTDRYSRSEVKFTRTVDVAELNKKGDELAREMRALDARIQAANWSTELKE